MEEIEFYLEDAKETMDRAMKHLAIELSKIRAGKAYPQSRPSVCRKRTGHYVGLALGTLAPTVIGQTILCIFLSTADLCRHTFSQQFTVHGLNEIHLQWTVNCRRLIQFTVGQHTPDHVAHIGKTLALHEPLSGFAAFS